MTNERALGKILKVEIKYFDNDPRNDIHVHFELRADGICVSTSINLHTQYAVLEGLCRDAEVINVLHLMHKPIWANIEENVLQDWGILKECI